MKQIGQEAKNALARLKKSGKPPEGDDSETPILVWQALVEMFGRAFVTSYGAEPPMLWARTILGLSDREIERGLTTLGEEGRKFPPNLSEFWNACKTIPERRFDGVEDKTDYKRLTQQRASPEFAAKWISKMKKNCGFI